MDTPTDNTSRLNNTDNAKFWAKIVSSILSSLNSLLDKIGDIFPWVKYWLNRPVILPSQITHWWHMGETGDQKPAMQITSYWYITNTTNRPIRILNSYIKKPRTLGHVTIKDVHSTYHGNYSVPPYTTTELHANFWIHPPFCKEGQNFKVDIVFVDQYGQKRTIKKVKFNSNKRKKTTPIKLTEESIYQLRGIEKTVATVLKDEISRYKKYGREHGELGSLYAIYNGKKIKRVYQDSWSSSQSGERQEILSNPKRANILSENGDNLVDLYNSLKKEEDKKLFTISLISRLNRNKEYYCVSYLIFYVLFRIGKLETALNAAKMHLTQQQTFLEKVIQKRVNSKLLETHQRHGFSDVLALINGILRFEHPSFSDTDLDAIEEFIADISEHTFNINEKINSIRSFRVSTS